MRRSQISSGRSVTARSSRGYSVGTDRLQLTRSFRTEDLRPTVRALDETFAGQDQLATTVGQVVLASSSAASTSARRPCANLRSR